MSRFKILGLLLAFALIPAAALAQYRSTTVVAGNGYGATTIVESEPRVGPVRAFFRAIFAPPPRVRVTTVAPVAMTRTIQTTTIDEPVAVRRTTVVREVMSPPLMGTTVIRSGGGVIVVNPGTVPQQMQQRLQAQQPQPMQKPMPAPSEKLPIRPMP